MRNRLALYAMMSLVVSATAAAAPKDIAAQRAAEVVAVMQGARPPAETFGERFLADVTPDKLAALSRQLQDANGRIVAAEEVRAEGDAATFRIRFERATAAGRLTLDSAAPFKVSGFWITSVIPLADDAAKIAADVAALPGSAGFAVTRLTDAGPMPLAGRETGRQFAVGSTFKLWVLDALAQDIEAGRLRWDQVVPLGPKSLPGGITQDWPEGAPVTIETLATLMISISDNTATDTLIRLIGRDRIDAHVKASGHGDPARMLPLLTTAEAFALKLGPAERRAAFARLDDAGQARLLAGIDAAKELATTKLAAPNGMPAAIDSIEWFASPEDVARVLDSLRRRKDPRVLAILGVAPNLSPDMKSRFAAVGYKGGSETGVLNLSWLLRRPDGAWHVVTASWNDPGKPVDEARFSQLALRMIALVP